MLVFDITSKRGETIPSIKRWLDPKYESGDNESAKIIPNYKYNNPKNWKDDFPKYDYTYARFDKLKQDLNVVKDQLDEYHKNVKSAKKYETISNLNLPLTMLRGPGGLLAKEFGAEIVSNAWLKMYELCILCNQLFDKVARGRDKHLNTVHLAEAPGNFILAINHYLKNHYPVSWYWKANSFRDLYSHGNTVYLSDHHGIMAATPENWFYGVDGDGDITSPANIRSFSDEISSKIKAMDLFNVNKNTKPRIHLVTSDVKYAPGIMNYSEEERINIPVHMGHAISVLSTLCKGGAMIIKELTFYEPMSISLIYLLSNCFDQLLMVKPETSRSFNSEVYLVGLGYKANISDIQINHLLNVMNYIREINNGNPVPPLFMNGDVPETFVNRLYNICETLQQSQIESLNTNIKSYKKHENQEYGIVETNNLDEKKRCADHWIKCTGINLLGYSDRIIKGAPLPYDP